MNQIIHVCCLFHDRVSAYKIKMSPQIVQQDETVLADGDLSFESESISESEEGDIEMDDMNSSFSDDLESALESTPVLLQSENEFPGLDPAFHRGRSHSDSSCDSLSSQSLQENDILHMRVQLSESASVFTGSEPSEIHRPGPSSSFSSSESTHSGNRSSSISSIGSALPPIPAGVTVKQPSLQPATPPSLDIQPFVL